MALKPRNVGYYLTKGIDVVGMHVEHNGKLGTIKAVIREPGPYSNVLEIKHFNGEPWDYRPWPALVNVLEREYTPAGGSLKCKAFVVC